MLEKIARAASAARESKADADAGQWGVELAGGMLGLDAADNWCFGYMVAVVVAIILVLVTDPGGPPLPSPPQHEAWGVRPVHMSQAGGRGGPGDSMRRAREKVVARRQAMAEAAAKDAALGKTATAYNRSIGERPTELHQPCNSVAAPVLTRHCWHRHARPRQRAHLPAAPFRHNGFRAGGIGGRRPAAAADGHVRALPIWRCEHVRQRSY